MKIRGTHILFSLSVWSGGEGCTRTDVHIFVKIRGTHILFSLSVWSVEMRAAHVLLSMFV